jgi:hypothetical protein
MCSGWKPYNMPNEAMLKPGKLLLARLKEGKIRENQAEFRTEPKTYQQQKS